MEALLLENGDGTLYRNPMNPKLDPDAMGTHSTVPDGPESPPRPAGVPRAQLRPGLVIDGRRQLLRPLGSGAFGSVYEARQLDLDRLEAIKFIHERWVDDPLHDFRDRFLDEARAMARIRGRHVVEIHDWGMLPGGLPYLVMERLVGQTLRERLREEALSLPEFFAIATQLLEGLCEVHDHDIVHRDVKPENIFLDERGLKLIDFGLARTSAAPDDALRIGTPLYMAPELMSGHGRPEVCTDLYAASVVMYEMLTGRRPSYRLDHVDEGSSAIFGARRLPPSAYRRDVPAKLDTLIMEGLAERPHARPRTARVILDRLDEIHYGSQRLAAPRRAVLPARSRGRGRGRGHARLSRFAALAGVVAMLGVTGMAAYPGASSTVVEPTAPASTVSLAEPSPALVRSDRSVQVTTMTAEMTAEMAAETEVSPREQCVRIELPYPLPPEVHGTDDSAPGVGHQLVSIDLHLSEAVPRWAPREVGRDARE